MAGRELSRTERPDGLVEVVVAVDNTTRQNILVPREIVDKPGYAEMIALAGVNHDRLVEIRDGLAQL